MAVVEQSLRGAVRLLPQGRGRSQQRAALGCKVQAATAAVFRVDGDFNEAAPLERLERSGERGAIHRQQRSDGGHTRRLWSIQRHEQRKLAVGEAEGAQSIVETARECACRALNVETEATVANPQGRLKRESRSP
jgi:hypothetical protein